MASPSQTYQQLGGMQQGNLNQRTLGRPRLPPLLIDLIMKTYFSGTCKPSSFEVWTAPGAPETTPEDGWGASRPAFWRGFWRLRDRPDPPNR